MSGAYLTADISCVELVHYISERCELCAFVNTGRGIYAVVYSDKTDVMLWKILLRIVTNLKVLAAQTRHIFYDYRADISHLDVINHSLKIRAIEVRAGIAIVRIDLCVYKAMCPRVALEHLLLRQDLSRVVSAKMIFFQKQ